MYKFNLNIKPLSVNQCYRTWRGRMLLSKPGREYKNIIEKVIKEQFLDEIIKENVKMKINLFFSDNRKRDCDNYQKPLIDCFNKNVLKDDSQIFDLRTIKHLGCEHDSIEIIIEELV